MPDLLGNINGCATVVRKLRVRPIFLPLRPIGGDGFYANRKTSNSCGRLFVGSSNGIRFQSMPLCCCPITCIASGPCRRTTLITRRGGCSSNHTSRVDALLRRSFRHRDPCGTNGNRRSGKVDSGSTRSVEKRISSGIATTSITTR